MRLGPAVGPVPNAGVVMFVTFRPPPGVDVGRPWLGGRVVPLVLGSVVSEDGVGWPGV